MKILKLIAFFSAILLGFLAQDWFTSQSSSDSEIDISKYCFLSTNVCQQDDISMTFQHDIAKPLMASNLTVEWKNTQSDTLLLELESLEMEMGKSKFLLQKQQDGTYASAIMLPVCTQDKMTWLGRLTDGTTTVYPAIRMER